ncbi:hypothetical protein T09_6130 [Trichinella sp. T9]|nr:hypothetical protein T09_6130 [Trichinella sp. T9]
MHTVGPGIWWKILECPLYDMEYGKKTENHKK